MLTSDEVIGKKRALRAEMKARRALLNESQCARASRQLCNRLAVFLEGRSDRTVGVYLSTPTEISLDSLIDELLLKGVQVAAPRLSSEKGQMNFWKFSSLAEVEVGPWRLRQPPANAPAGELSLIIVPGLAFDLQGGRLGMGGGWYDRFLRPEITTVGVGFECQLVLEVPVEKHDFRVNYVASESRFIGVPT